MERFAPTVRLAPCGTVVTPPGWVWVVGLAMAGCRWAIDECGRPEFREVVREQLRQDRVRGLLMARARGNRQ